MGSFLESLRLSAWRTAGARYEAARRLRRRELFATWSVALFGALTAGLVFVQRVYAFGISSKLDDYLAALTACLGIFVLAVSLIESGAANGAKAQALHKNAEELNAHQRKIELSLERSANAGPENAEHADALREEYENLKARCAFNHEPIDDARFRAYKREAIEFAKSDGKPSIGRTHAAWISVCHWWASVWYFGLLWVAVLASLLLAHWITK